MTNIPHISSTSSYTLNHPSYGISPSGFGRLSVELLPKEVSRLVGYDPRVLIIKPRKPGARAPRGTPLVPHNVSKAVIDLQNQVQRSIDIKRVAVMVEYLRNALERGSFADWGPIDLVTSSKPDLTRMESDHVATLDIDGDYFIADGQHRYCALLDFVREYPHFADRFTQSVVISVLPEDRLTEWAGQSFHDRNYFAVAVRAGKALTVDSRDPVNSLAKALYDEPTVIALGGIAMERDTLLTGDPRFTTHSVIHRFVRGFLAGRGGVDKDAAVTVEPVQAALLREYLGKLAAVLPWEGPERDSYLTRTSVVLTALSVVGHDLYTSDRDPVEIDEAIRKLGRINWSRSNLGLVGVVGSEKNGLVQPASSRPAIDATIRWLRQVTGLIEPNGMVGL